jgi:hypothetical protein
MRNSRVWIFGCAALAALAAATALPASALGGPGAPVPPPATTSGGALAPPQPPAPPPLPPGPEWRETATHEIPGDGVAACLRAAGTGQLTLFGGETRTTTTAALLLHDPAAGLVPGPATTFGPLYDCPTAAPGPDDAPPLLAAPSVVRKGRRWTVMQQVAAAGSPPQTISKRSDGNTGSLATAPGGAAALAWLETPREEVTRLLVAIRPPGADRFGRPREVATGMDGSMTPQVGVDRRGRAHVAWIAEAVSDDPEALLHVASSRRDGSFGRPQLLGRSWADLDSVALAVAPNGRALLVGPLQGSSGAWELTPRAAAFARIPLGDVAAYEPAVALADDGSAVLAYRNSGVAVLRRAPGGRFGADEDVYVPPEREDSGQRVIFFGGDAAAGQPPSDAQRASLRVALSPSGEIVVAWTTEDDENEAGIAYVARGTVAGGMSMARRLGGSCRPARGTTPLLLPDGRLAVAWSDNARVSTVSDEDELLGGGRVHVAQQEGSAPARPPAPALPQPRVTASVLDDGPLGGGQSLRLRVSCGDLPCDVRAASQSRQLGPASFWPDAGTQPSTASTTVAAGGSAELELGTRARHGFAPAGGARRVPIELTVCPPGGPAVQQLTLRPQLRGRPLPPAPRIRGLRAQRRDGEVVVTWRTTVAPPRSSVFYVFGVGRSEHSRELERIGSTAITVRRSRTRFRAVIKAEEGRLPGRVVVMVQTPAVDNAAEARVRVR